MANKNEITFEIMKELVKKYKIISISGKEVIVDKKTNELLIDKIMIAHVRFAHLWLNVVGKKWRTSDPVFGYHYAYEDENAKEAFCFISNFINQIILEKGYIDTIELLRKIKAQFGDYRYAEDILVGLFSSIKNINIVSTVFMLENPLIEINEELPQVLYNHTDAMLRLKERERLILEKQISLSEDPQKRKR